MKRHILAAVLLLLACVGVWGGMDLTAEHLAVLTNPDHHSWCTVEGTKFDCAKVSQSRWAEHQIFLFTFPLPTSVPPIGFYVVFAALVLLGWWRRGGPDYPASQARDDTLAFAWLLLLPAAVVDLLLIYVMKFVLQTWCIVCLTLDVTTALLLILTPFARTTGWDGLFKSGVLGGMRHYNWLVAGVLFCAAVVIGQTWYAGGLREAIVEEQRTFVDEFWTQEPTLGDIPADVPRLGDADAPFHVVEYADFECPYCAVCSARIHALIEAYPGQVDFVFRHFPLGTDCNPYNRNNMHPDACAAAYAADCAGREGQFWPMYNALFTAFENRPRGQRVEIDQIRELAHDLGLPASDFFYCLEDETVRAGVIAAVEEGRAAGVRGTPAVFVNGIMLGGGAAAAQRLELIIRDHLREQGVELDAPITYPEL